MLLRGWLADDLKPSTEALGLFTNSIIEHMTQLEKVPADKKRSSNGCCLTKMDEKRAVQIDKKFNIDYNY